MIETLVTGKIFGAPKQGTTRNGGSYANAKIKVPSGDGEVLFASVITFHDTAVQALIALTDGDPVACVGTLKLSTYTAKTGETRISLDIAASQVLTLYQVKRKRDKSVAGDDSGDAPPQQRTGQWGRSKPQQHNGRPNDEAWQAMANGELVDL